MGNAGQFINSCLASVCRIELEARQCSKSGQELKGPGSECQTFENSFSEAMKLFKHLYKIGQVGILASGLSSKICSRIFHPSKGKIKMLRLEISEPDIKKKKRTSRSHAF